MVPLPQGPLNTSRMTYQACINPPNVLREYVRSKQCLSIVLFSCKKKPDLGNQKVIEVAVTISVSSLTADAARTLY